MCYSSVCRQFLQLTCIPEAFCSFLSLLVWISVPRMWSISTSISLKFSHWIILNGKVVKLIIVLLSNSLIFFLFLMQINWSKNSCKGRVKKNSCCLDGFVHIYFLSVFRCLAKYLVTCLFKGYLFPPFISMHLS